GTGTHTLSGPFVVDSVDARVRAETSTIVISSNITEGPDVTPGTGVLTLDGDFAGFVTLTGDNTGIGVGGIKLIGGELNVSSEINLRGGQTFWDAGIVNVNGAVTLASLHLRSPVVNIGTGGSVTLTSGSNSFGQDSTGTNGGPDIATVNLSGNGQLVQTSGDDFNISDNANTQGTINIHDSAVFTTGGITWLGKGTNAVGTINQDGGTVTINRSGNFGLVLGDGRSSTNPTGHYNLGGTGVLNVAGEMYVGEGANGIGFFNMTGGTVTLKNWFVVGRENAVGTVDISGGIFNHNTNGNMSIGESGKANS